MRTEQLTQNQGHCTKLVLAEGANVSARNEAYGLEGFGSGAVVRPASWCAGLILHGDSKAIFKKESAYNKN